MLNIGNEHLKTLIDEINSFEERVNIMEVCGSHTEAIGRFGLRSILNDNLNLISGPGCPVCVTHSSYIDYVYELALSENITIATYGDMIRVPGSKPSITLERAKALGGDVKIVYSSVDALALAVNNPYRKTLFLGIGFETTAPHTAIAIKEAKSNNIENFYVLSLHKSVEPVMKCLLKDRNLNIQGFLCPGHVAAIIGEKGFYFLRNYNCPGVITGFKIGDIIVGLWKLLKMIKERNVGVENAYKSLVSKDGNIVAVGAIEEVFYKGKDYWRGIGVIDDSGFKIKDEYEKYNIENIYPLKVKKFEENTICQCGEVLKGIIRPQQCKLFKKICTPENPIGPCMVSVEGSCAAYYNYYL